MIKECWGFQTIPDVTKNITVFDSRETKSRIAKELLTIIITKLVLWTPHPVASQLAIYCDNTI